MMRALQSLWGAMAQQVQLRALEAAYTDLHTRFQSVLHTLGWNEADVATPIPGPELSQCPHNANHWLPAKAMPAHVWRCQLRAKGIDPDKVRLACIQPKCGTYHPI